MFRLAIQVVDIIGVRPPTEVSLGRQIQVILNRADEDLLLQRLRKDGDVRVFEFFAAAPDSLWVSHFNDQASGHLTYRFWH